MGGVGSAQPMLLYLPYLHGDAWGECGEKRGVGLDGVQQQEGVVGGLVDVSEVLDGQVVEVGELCGRRRRRKRRGGHDGVIG